MASSPFQALLRHPKVVSGLLKRELGQHGFSILDGALGGNWASQAKAEIRALQKAARLHLNATHHVLPDNTVEVLPKHGIWELSSEALLRDEASNLRWGLSSTSPMVVETPTLDAFVTESMALYPVLARAGFERSDTSSLRDCIQTWRTTVKIQFNAGEGGCFPLHYDTAPGVDSRFLTAIYYTNESWWPGHGGELQLYPFPYESPPLIEPISDRLVFFSSRNMLHRVLPAAKERYCITFWIYMSEDEAVSHRASTGKPFKPVPNVTSNVDMAESVALSLLLAPQIRRHFARIALGLEWCNSLEASHPKTPASTKVFQRHRNESSSIEAALQKYLKEIGLEGRAQDPKALADAHLPVSKEAHPDLVRWF